MRWVSVVQVSVVAAVAAGTFAVMSNPAVEGQARTAGIPRLNGKPDLNGLWQAVNSANWDIQAHSAKAALAMRPGPVVPVPAKTDSPELGPPGAAPRWRTSRKELGAALGVQLRAMEVPSTRAVNPEGAAGIAKLIPVTCTVFGSRLQFPSPSRVHRA